MATAAVADSATLCSTARRPGLLSMPSQLLAMVLRTAAYASPVSYHINHGRALDCGRAECWEGTPPDPHSLWTWHTTARARFPKVPTFSLA